MLSKEVSKYLDEFFNNDLYEQALEEIKEEDEDSGDEFETSCDKVKEMCGGEKSDEESIVPKEKMKENMKEENMDEGNREKGLSIYIGKIKKSRGY